MQLEKVNITIYGNNRNVIGLIPLKIKTLIQLIIAFSGSSILVMTINEDFVKVNEI